MDVTPMDKIYILKHKLLSDVVKFSISPQPEHEFIKNLTNHKNALSQFLFVSTVECEDPSSVFINIQQSLALNKAYGEFYQISPKEALKVVRREAYRIPIVQYD
ncbi:hypothetical protein ACOYR1_13330 [Thalassotalea piscium]